VRSALRDSFVCLAGSASVALLSIGAWASDAESPSLSRLGLPPISMAPSGEVVQLAILGAQLFADPRLSASGNISCASCHAAERAFTDGRAVAAGDGGKLTTRNAPSLLNVVFEKHLFWDGRTQGLEAQAVAPLTNPIEHALASEQAVIDIVLSTPHYAREFEKIPSLRNRKLQIADIGSALAAFERTLIAGGSAFDLYQYAGRSRALSEAGIRGLKLFQGRAKCVSCHVIEEKYATFSDGDFHAAGRLPRSAVSNLSSLTQRLVSVTGDRAARELLVASDQSIAALGRFIATLDPNDIGKFKTPSLRNVALTAPYMHDGNVATLAEAIDRELYARTSAGNYPIALTLAERADLLVFLESLTSPAANR
jgi:cytochrome c peroxidase